MAIWAKIKHGKNYMLNRTYNIREHLLGPDPVKNALSLAASHCIAEWEISEDPLPAGADIRVVVDANGSEDLIRSGIYLISTEPTAGGAKAVGYKYIGTGLIGRDPIHYSDDSFYIESPDDGEGEDKCSNWRSLGDEHEHYVAAMENP